MAEKKVTAGTTVVDTGGKRKPIPSVKQQRKPTPVIGLLPNQIQVGGDT